MLPAGREFDGGGATKCRRVVILSSSRNIDDNSFCVAADVDPVYLALPCSGEAVERGANGYGHGAGAADASACGSFGFLSRREAPLGVKEFLDSHQSRKPHSL